MATVRAVSAPRATGTKKTAGYGTADLTGPPNVSTPCTPRIPLTAAFCPKVFVTDGVADCPLSI